MTVPTRTPAGAPLPSPGGSADNAIPKVRDVLNSIADTCPECRQTMARPCTPLSGLPSDVRLTGNSGGEADIA